MRVKTLFNFDKLCVSRLLAILKPTSHIMRLFLRRKHDLELREEIRFEKPSGEGSLLIPFPAFLELRQRYTGLRIQLITTERTAPFVRSLGVFDQI